MEEEFSKEKKYGDHSLGCVYLERKGTYKGKGHNSWDESNRRVFDSRNQGASKIREWPAFLGVARRIRMCSAENRSILLHICLFLIIYSHFIHFVFSF